MVYLFIGMIVFCSLVLCLLLFFQNSKQNGQGGAILNASADQLVGVKSSSDFLEKATWVLVVLIFSLSIQVSAILKRKNNIYNASANVRSASEQPLIINKH